ncbi:hypothetical protein FBALC1_16347 [Flavobacteriales bacterium ALC-1]|nr:hypothetical protein FBALC1_16347 [Flavobacteriales bacterium ALC-1]
MTLDYKNSTIHYTTSGEGPTVVFLHGFLETIDMWNGLISKLSKHQVICIDLLGHGKTDCLGYVHTMEAMADAVFAVLNHLKIKKAKFIGHSMGGYVCLALAEKQPLLFKGLCLMNSTFEADDDQRKLIRSRAIKLAQTHYETLVGMSFANLFAPASRTTFKKEFDDALELALQTPVQGYIAAQEGMKLRPNRFDVFKNLNCKQLIIIGKKDAVVNGDSIISKIKGTSINYIEFSEGHMSYIENESELSYELLRFIEK